MNQGRILHKKCIGSLRDGGEELNPIHNYTASYYCQQCLLVGLLGGILASDMYYFVCPPEENGLKGNHWFVGCIPSRGVRFAVTRCAASYTLASMDCVSVLLLAETTVFVRFYDHNYGKVPL